MPLYTSEVMETFKTANSASETDSHVYKTAEEAFRKLTGVLEKNQKVPSNQSLIVCGESGSGKTVI